MILRYFASRLSSGILKSRSFSFRALMHIVSIKVLVVSTHSERFAVLA